MQENSNLDLKMNPNRVTHSAFSEGIHKNKQTYIVVILFSLSGPGKFYRISTHNLKLPPQTHGNINFDTLNSIGSETGSLSDIHTERYTNIIINKTAKAFSLIVTSNKLYFWQLEDDYLKTAWQHVWQPPDDFLTITDWCFWHFQSIFKSTQSLSLCISFF